MVLKVFDNVYYLVMQHHPHLICLIEKNCFETWFTIIVVLQKMILICLKCGCTNLAMVDDTGLPAYNEIHPQVNMLSFASHVLFDT